MCFVRSHMTVLRRAERSSRTACHLPRRGTANARRASFFVRRADVFVDPRTACVRRRIVYLRRLTVPRVETCASSAPTISSTAPSPRSPDHRRAQAGATIGTTGDGRIRFGAPRLQAPRDRTRRARRKKRRPHGCHVHVDCRDVARESIARARAEKKLARAEKKLARERKKNPRANREAARELSSGAGVERLQKGEQRNRTMRKDIRRRHDAHIRTLRVCTEHSALFDATPGGKKTRTTLGSHVADVTRLLALQERSR